MYLFKALLCCLSSLCNIILEAFLDNNNLRGSENHIQILTIWLYKLKIIFLNFSLFNFDLTEVKESKNNSTVMKFLFVFALIGVISADVSEPKNEITEEITWKESIWNLSKDEKDIRGPNMICIEIQMKTNFMGHVVN